MYGVSVCAVIARKKRSVLVCSLWRGSQRSRSFRLQASFSGVHWRRASGVIDVVVLVHVGAERGGEKLRAGRFERRLQQFVGLRIAGSVQPVPFVVELDHRLERCGSVAASNSQEYRFQIQSLYSIIQASIAVGRPSTTGVQKVDLQPVSGTDPDQVAVDETVS